MWSLVAAFWMYWAIHLVVGMLLHIAKVECKLLTWGEALYLCLMWTLMAGSAIEALAERFTK